MFNSQKFLLGQLVFLSLSRPHLHKGNCHSLVSLISFCLFLIFINGRIQYVLFCVYFQEVIKFCKACICTVISIWLLLFQSFFAIMLAMHDQYRKFEKYWKSGEKNNRPFIFLSLKDIYLIYFLLVFCQWIH